MRDQQISSPLSTIALESQNSVASTSQLPSIDSSSYHLILKTVKKKLKTYVKKHRWKKISLADRKISVHQAEAMLCFEAYRSLIAATSIFTYSLYEIV